MKFSSVLLTGMTVLVCASSCNTARRATVQPAFSPIESNTLNDAQDELLATPGLKTAHIGISVYDPADNKYLYNYQGDKYFVPASNTKIATCYAAMKYLGDSLAGARYAMVNDSTIEIEPAADPTLLHRDFKTQPLFSLLKQFAIIRIAKPVYDGGFMGDGWAWNDFMDDYMVQRSNLPVYGNVVLINKKTDTSVAMMPAAFKKTSTVTEKMTNGFELAKSWDANVFVFKNGGSKLREVPFKPDLATIIALLSDTLNRQVEADFNWKAPFSNTIYSQPTDSMLRPMMHRSDNFFAEQSLLMVSNERLGVMDDAKIIDVLLNTDFKDLPQKPKWVDGSGLSRYNLFTPQDLVSILNKMKNEFSWNRITSIFPTGDKGTLENYYKNLPGKIFAKTGSLGGQVALSGYLLTRKNRTLIFSVLVNNHQTSTATVRRSVEKFLTAVYNQN